MKTVTGEASLRTTLKAYSVPVDTWGVGKERDVSDLLKEIDRGESVLKVDGEEGLTRVVEIINIDIRDLHNPRGSLLEWSQTFPDGCVHERKQCPSGKMKAEETPEIALSRELREKFKLNSDDWTGKWWTTNIEQCDSQSYPGLTTTIHIHHFKVWPNQGSPVLRDEFTIKDPDGSILHFRWAHLVKQP